MIPLSGSQSSASGRTSLTSPRPMRPSPLPDRWALPDRSDPDAATGLDLAQGRQGKAPRRQCPRAAAPVPSSPAFKLLDLGQELTDESLPTASTSIWMADAIRYR